MRAEETVRGKEGGNKVTRRGFKGGIVASLTLTAKMIQSWKMASYSQQRTDLKPVSVWQWDVLLSFLLLSVCVSDLCVSSCLLSSPPLLSPLVSSPLLLSCLLLSSLLSSCFLSSPPLLSLLLTFYFNRFSSVLFSGFSLFCSVLSVPFSLLPPACDALVLQVANQSAVSQEQVDNILQENDALRTNLAALEQVINQENIIQKVLPRRTWHIQSKTIRTFKVLKLVIKLRVSVRTFGFWLLLK